MRILARAESRGANILDFKLFCVCFVTVLRLFWACFDEQVLGDLLTRRRCGRRVRHDRRQTIRCEILSLGFMLDKQ